ncbi:MULTISPECIES: hypothetical protein [Pseudomonas syringae group]|uniref:hypothetical protein n=1 Tax=Pseudomonas syringae group TaxID=136849 RepID=UPI0012B80C81|nr:MULTISPECIES: hypothetical protein [Pseudomonas syringae group]
MKYIPTTSVLEVKPQTSTAVTSDEAHAQEIRSSLSVDVITAERHSLTEISKARYETGDRAGLAEPSGHYMAGDSAGCTVLDWMTAAERLRFHLLGLALPSFGEERLAARSRIQERIAARKRNALTRNFNSSPEQAAEIC